MLNKLAEEMEGIFEPYAPGGDITKVFDVLTFSAATKETVMYNAVPILFRSHWTKYVFLLLS
jgi:phenol 2-monooxygenase